MADATLTGCLRHTDMAIKFPNDTQRHTIIGKTGSGKTQAGLWSLSNRSYTSKPWIIWDFKLDDLIADIPNTTEIGVTDKLPKKPGLYPIRPLPGQEEDVERQLWEIWKKENVGMYIDEGYMIDRRSKAFQAILTQGRSKRIPVVMLTQRPVELSRFCFSEADYIQLFQLTDMRDIKTVKEFMPMPIEKPIPQYHSWWYDNARNYKAVLTPVPDKETIIGRFRDRLGARRKIY